MEQAPRELTCACGRRFACGVASGRCWCFDLPRTQTVPAAAGVATCLCPACLAVRTGVAVPVTVRQSPPTG